MDRRGFLKSVVCSMGTVGIVGCVDAIGSSVDEQAHQPDQCPVSTLDDQDPPDELDRETAERFVRSYESNYIEHARIDVDRYGRVEGPMTTIEDTTAADDGYVIVVETRWTTLDPSPERTLEFERVEETEIEPVPIDNERLAENETLRQLVKESVEEGWGGTLDEEHPDYESIRTGIEDNAGQLDGAVIEYQGKPVRVSKIERAGVHGDHVETAAYYVTAEVVSRSGDPDPDADDGDVVEC